MANVHGFWARLDGGGIQYVLVMHFPVPDEVNAVGVSLRDAVNLSGIGGKSILPKGRDWPVGGFVTDAEYQLIDCGAVYEHVEEFKWDIETVAQLATRAQEEWEGRQSGVIDELRVRLRYYGLSVPMPEPPEEE